MFGENVAKEMYLLFTGEDENENYVTLPLADENVTTQVDSNKFPLN